MAHINLWTFAFLVVSVVCSSPCPKECHSCTKHGLSSFNKSVAAIQALCHRRGLTKVPVGFPPNVKTLRAYENKISNLQRLPFQNLQLLENLYLWKNEIERVDNGTFVDLEYLLKLYLNHNKISAIYKETFLGLGRLQILELDWNHLTFLHRGTFRYLSSLKNLAVNYNKIAFIQDGSFEGMDFLLKLEVRGNRIKTLNSETLGSLMSLNSTDFSSNGISVIDNYAFHCIPLLQRLDLRQNKLKNIPWLRHMKFLKHVDLSQNAIKEIEDASFESSTMLSVLKLDSNNISTVHARAFDGVTSLEKLFLNNNPLECDCDLRWFREWLSWKPNTLQYSDHTRCIHPVNHLNRNLLNISLSDLLCTCETCRKEANCLSVEYCNCTSDWSGTSCNAVCKLDTSHVSLKTGYDLRCYNNSQEDQKTRFDFETCTFNMTKEICSENAFPRKVGKSLQCACHSGFSGNGTTCTDLNECKTTNHLCHKGGADCINTVGSYKCKCRLGYNDEKLGEVGKPLDGHWCKDINECNKLESCHKNAFCNNTPGMKYPFVNYNITTCCLDLF